MMSSRGPSATAAGSISIRDPEPVASASSAHSSMASTAPSMCLSDMIATPTGAMMPTRLDFQSPMHPQARLASSMMLATPEGKKALGLMLLEGATTPSLALPMACNFEALSHHFHLPLKIAAEKFGVRATAFKKRCRAIGIRHWPYRKVRSLKRSLQELNRCRDQGLLNDKQHHQLLVFQAQLDKLLSPETYGIDPSGRLPPGTFDNDEGDDNDSNGDDIDDDDASCTSNQSPRIDTAACFSDFQITAFHNRQKSHLGLLRRGDFAISTGMSCNGAPPSYHSLPAGEEPPTPHGSGGSLHHGDLMPSVSVRFASHASHANHGLPGFDSYDPFFQDFKNDFTLTMEDFGGDETSGSAYGIDGSHHHDDLFQFARSPTMASLRASASSGLPNRSSSRPSSAAPSASTDSQTRSPDESSDAPDDDVFLQISPDYGCLV